MSFQKFHKTHAFRIGVIAMFVGAIAFWLHYTIFETHTWITIGSPTTGESVIINGTRKFIEDRFPQYAPHKLTSIYVRTDPEDFVDPVVKNIVGHCHGDTICLLRGHVMVFNCSHEIGHIVWPQLTMTFKARFSQISDGLYGEQYYPDPKFGLGHDGFIRPYGRRNPEENFCDFFAACMASLYYRHHTKESRAWEPFAASITRDDARLLENLRVFHEESLLTDEDVQLLQPMLDK